MMYPTIEYNIAIDSLMFVMRDGPYVIAYPFKLTPKQRKIWDEMAEQMKAKTAKKENG